MKANQRQVGGSHYKTEYEHWDLVIILNLGYLEGCATKYVSRWRKKGGLADLEKGLHYLEKMIEVWEIYDDNRICSHERMEEEVHKFCDANELSDAEEAFVLLMCTYADKDDLIEARDILLWIMSMKPQQVQIRDELPPGPGTPEDGGHHSRQPPD
jgi:hypothetical protein